MAKNKLSSIPTSMFLSGVESKTYWDIVVNKGGIRNVLTSYHYFRKQPKDTLKKRVETTPDVNVFIDSGAFTFFSKGHDNGEEFWEEYLKNYTEWARENKDYIFAIANLDIEAIVGQEKVLEWNKKYFEPLEADGILVCYIWHGMTGEETWEDYCRKYDYVGFSSDESTQMTTQRRQKFISVAKKHGAVVHGMSLLDTQMMCKIPMFSCDSTAWLVGQQYGECIWFDGRKMRRLSKTEWQRNFKTKLLREPFNADWDRLIKGMGGKGDTYELLRINVLAYKLAEEHVRKRLGKKMYWLNRGKTAEDGLKKLGEIKLPNRDWFDGDMHDYKQYLDELGISIQAPKDELLDILFDFYTYLTLDPDILDEISDDDIIDTCNMITGESVEDRKEALKTLNRFYTDNATGVRSEYKDELEEVRAKERGYYIEEEEFQVVDLAGEDIPEIQVLPDPNNAMPEVEAYDEELKKQGIEIVRDEKGRFVKGQKRIVKPKNIYSEKYPKLMCSTCYKSGDCPEYREGYVCAFDKMFKRFDTRNANDVIEAMSSIVNMNLGRLQKAMMFETMDGGFATQEVSTLVDQNMKLLEKIKEVHLHTPKAILQQRRTFNPDGTEIVDTSMSVNPHSGGILSKIFGTPSAESDEEVIDAEYTVMDGEVDKDKPTKKKRKKLKRKG